MMGNYILRVQTIDKHEVNVFSGKRFVILRV